MEAQLKGAVLIALVVVPQWRCPILKPLSAKLPPKSETAPHPGWQDGTILQPGKTKTRISENKEYLLNSVIDCSSAILCRKVLHINMAYVTHNIHNIPLLSYKTAG